MNPEQFQLVPAISSALFAIIIVILLAWPVLPMKHLAALLPWSAKKDEPFEPSDAPTIICIYPQDEYAFAYEGDDFTMDEYNAGVGELMEERYLNPDGSVKE